MQPFGGYSGSSSEKGIFDGHIGDVLTCHIFSAETGEEIPYAALLKEGWQDAAAWYRIDNRIFDGIRYMSYNEEEHQKVDLPDLAEYRLADLGFMVDGKLALAFQPTAPGGGTYIALLPPDQLKN